MSLVGKIIRDIGKIMSLVGQNKSVVRKSMIQAQRRHQLKDGICIA